MPGGWNLPTHILFVPYSIAMKNWQILVDQVSVCPKKIRGSGNSRLCFSSGKTARRPAAAESSDRVPPKFASLPTTPYAPPPRPPPSLCRAKSNQALGHRGLQPILQGSLPSVPTPCCLCPHTPRQMGSEPSRAGLSLSLCSQGRSSPKLPAPSSPVPPDQPSSFPLPHSTSKCPGRGPAALGSVGHTLQNDSGWHRVLGRPGMHPPCSPDMSSLGKGSITVTYPPCDMWAREGTWMCIK